jgi:hypothetical protein
MEWLMDGEMKEIYKEAMFAYLTTLSLLSPGDTEKSIGIFSVVFVPVKIVPEYSPSNESSC